MKFKSFLINFFFFFLLFFSLSRVGAYAANIYIGPSGSDSNNGSTEGQAVETIDKACQLANAGDTILFLDGTYSLSGEQTIDDGCSGTAQAYTTFRAKDGAGTATINNAYIVIYEAEYIIIDGLEVQNSTDRGIGVTRSEHIFIQNNTVHDVQGRGIGANGDYITIQNNTIYSACKSNEEHTADSGWPSALSINNWYNQERKSQHIIIKNNIVRENHGEGIGVLFGNDVRVEGNTVYNNYGVNIYIDNTTNARITKNYIYTNSDAFNKSPDGSRARGVSLATENYSETSILGLSNILIDSNVIADTSYGISYYWSSGGWYQADGTYENIDINHNTIYVSSAALSGGKAKYGIRFTETGSAAGEGNEIKNNIIYAGTEGSLTIDSSGISAWTMSHNNWVNGVPTEGTHTGSIAVDPQFVSPSVGGSATGFKLQAGSSSIHVGTFLSSVSTDYEGAARNNPPTLGAFEYSAPNPSSPPDAAPNPSSPPDAVGEKMPVYRFWSDQRQGHFYTASEEEKNYVINNYDDFVWGYEGIAFYAFNSQISGTVPVYRFWSDQKRGHFYTASEEEKNYVINNYDDFVWGYEGIGFYVYPTTKTDSIHMVYRFWSDRNQHHFYTASTDERDYVLNMYDDYTWRYEGIGWHVPQ